MSTVIVTGSFDDLKSRHMRFLQEAAKLGPVVVLLWADDLVHDMEGHAPKFPLAERQYFVESIRYVERVHIVAGSWEADALPIDFATQDAIWVVEASANTPAKRTWCASRKMRLCSVSEDQISGFPEPANSVDAAPGRRPKVIVTGCYDWFHTGHVRFFEEVAEIGELYVVVGHDANVRALKGEGHPLFSEQERRYMAGSIRFVRQSLVSSGDGWLDAEPEIERVRPDIYAVNEDGDRPEKREFCESHGIEYRILKRVPKEGLPKRESTNLRGF